MSIFDRLNCEMEQKFVENGGHSVRFTVDSLGQNVHRAGLEAKIRTFGEKDGNYVKIGQFWVLGGTYEPKYGLEFGLEI